jgi:hypothetical protein
MQKNMAGRHNFAAIGAQNGEAKRPAQTQPKVELNRHNPRTYLMATQAQIRSAALVVQAIVETIEEMGDKGAPLGIVYSALMGMISFDSFSNVIQSLVTAGVIEVKGNVAYGLVKK